MTPPADNSAKFEGADVIRTAIIVSNAGDGLSDAVKTEPKIIHRGDKGYVIFEYVCTEVRFAPADRDNPEGDAVRVAKLKAGTAVFADSDEVHDLIEAQREANTLAREAEAGIQRLGFDDDEDGEPEDDEDEGLPPEAGTAAALGMLSKDELRELCTEHGIVYRAKATGKELVESLQGVPGILAEAQARIEAKLPAKPTDEQLAQVAEGGADNVRPIRQEAAGE